MKLHKTLIKLLFVTLPCLCAYNAFSEDIDSALLSKVWEAKWIVVPGAPTKEYGVFKFRKNFELATQPASFIMHVSADNRYKLFVNGNMVSLGPARGDFFHWNFETVDIAGKLQPGKNTIAALVWNEGESRPEAQISYVTAFILQGNGAAEKTVNTNETWKCIQDSSYRPLTPHVKGYYAAGNGEIVDMNRQVKDWLKPGFNDGNWTNASGFSQGIPKGVFSYTYSWMLQPSPIPAMELKQERLVNVRQSTGVQLPLSWPAATGAVTVPANTHAVILLDQAYLTNAYPSIMFSKGKGATISLGYAEALYSNGDNKDNRNQVEGKMFIGKKDSIISDGTNQQQFTSLWWRTYRYLQLKVDTKQQPLTIDDIYGTFTGYPFTLQSAFKGATPQLQKILDIGWHTARLCAVETYMDCPYYEQLQYIGDARIQALVTLYNSGDDRLVRNALNLMDRSRMAEGITLSRYPTANPQEIPFFSLWYIGMLNDYRMYRDDSNFIKEKLPGVRQVLNFFQKYQGPDGSLKNVPYWTFTDWVSAGGWRDGMAPIGKDGSSAAQDLQLLLACQLAAGLENDLGMHDYAVRYTLLAAKLKATIQQKYWDAQKNLYADTPEKDRFSQHTNALAILTGVITANSATLLAQKILADSSIAQASIYFKYYLHRAAIKAGLGNDYLQWLGKWNENIQLGLTTWAEMSDVAHSRSDCHAWGSSPNIELYRTVLGIDSDAPGFAKVYIEPHLGTLETTGGTIPHPKGSISVDYKKNGDKWNALIVLPDGITGSFVWKAKKYALKPGKNNFQL